MTFDFYWNPANAWRYERVPPCRPEFDPGDRESMTLSEHSPEQDLLDAI